MLHPRVPYRSGAKLGTSFAGKQHKTRYGKAVQVEHISLTPR